MIRDLFYLTVFNLDLLGFSLLAIGYILYSTPISEKKLYYLSGGVFIVGWVIIRIISQYIFPFVLLENGRAYFDMLEVLTPQPWGGGLEEAIRDKPHLLTYRYDLIVMWNFIFGGLSLGVGSILIWRAQSGKEGRLFMIYGLINLIAVLMYIPLFLWPYLLQTGEYVSTSVLIPGVLMKGFLVPIIAVIAFRFLRRESKKLIEIVDQS
ncbi:MAG: hypothetical protein ACFFAJ_01815 [Candidatus Hodarchaeota archaeon]